MTARWYRDAETERLKPTVNKGIATDAEGRFYFWDETWSEACGPYENLNEVKLAIQKYVEHLR